MNTSDDYSHRYTSLSRTLIQKLYLADKRVTLFGCSGKKVEAAIVEDDAKAELIADSLLLDISFEVFGLRSFEYAHQAAQGVNLRLSL